MDPKEMRDAMDNTLTEKSRAWLTAWVENHQKVILHLPKEEAQAILDGCKSHTYSHGNIVASDRFLRALKKLELGTTSVPVTRVETQLFEHLNELLTHVPSSFR